MGPGSSWGSVGPSPPGCCFWSQSVRFFVAATNGLPAALRITRAVRSPEDRRVTDPARAGGLWGLARAGGRWEPDRAGGRLGPAPAGGLWAWIALGTGGAEPTWVLFLVTVGAFLRCNHCASCGPQNHEGCEVTGGPPGHRPGSSWGR